MGGREGNSVRGEEGVAGATDGSWSFFLDAKKFILAPQNALRQEARHARLYAHLRSTSGTPAPLHGFRTTATLFRGALAHVLIAACPPVLYN